MKKLLCLLLCGLLLLSSCSAQSGDSTDKGKTAPAADAAPAAEESNARYEGGGFATPEDAVLAYLAGLKNLDIGRMLSAYAWETQAEHYSFRDFILRAKGIDSTYVPGMPFTSGLLVSANLEQMRQMQVTAIYQALEVYLLRENHMSNTNTYSIKFENDAEIEAYFRLFSDSGRLQSLAAMDNIRFYSSDDVTGFNEKPEAGQERLRELYEKQTRQYGADEVRDIVVLFDAGKETLYAAPTAARYGEKWYLVNVSSFTSGMFGISVNEQAFCLVPDNMREYIPSWTPYQTASLPESAAEPARYEGSGFGTPEEAVAAYLEGLKNMDMRQMLAAFAWETQAGRYSLKDLFLRNKSVYSDLCPRMPSADGTLDRFNLHAIRSRQARLIYNAIRAYVVKNTELYDRIVSMRIDLPAEEDVDAFIGLYSNARIPLLAAMTNIRACAPAEIAPAYDNENVREQLAAWQRIYGADELRELIGAADLGSETIICNPLVARYGERWYLVSVSGIAFSVLGVDLVHQAFIAMDGTFGQITAALFR